MRKSISVVVPMYNNSKNIDVFFARLIPVLNELSFAWEVICIEDGSTDYSFEKLSKWHASFRNIKLIRLSRNFGKEAALTAGFDYASGDAVLPIDGDLQDPPELISDMIKKWSSGYDIVLTIRSNRSADGFLKRFTASLFYKLIKKTSKIHIEENAGDYRLLDAKVVNAIRNMPERVRFMKGVMSWPGFRETKVFYERKHAASTKWRYRDLFQLALDGVFSFSSIPIKIWSYIGIMISSFSFIYMIFVVIFTLVNGISVPGYSSIITVVLFLGGIQLISLGTLGEYIARIYIETKRRPIYVISDSCGFDVNNPQQSDNQILRKITDREIPIY